MESRGRRSEESWRKERTWEWSGGKERKKRERRGGERGGGEERKGGGRRGRGGQGGRGFCLDRESGESRSQAGN